MSSRLSAYYFLNVYRFYCDIYEMAIKIDYLWYDEMQFHNSFWTYVSLLKSSTLNIVFYTLDYHKYVPADFSIVQYIKASRYFHRHDVKTTKVREQFHELTENILQHWSLQTT